MLPAFILGLAGSLHCVGMCGPLMLSLPNAAGGHKGRALWESIQYQLGRILTYALLGLLFGLLGKGIALAGLQKGLSVFAGVMMIAAGFWAWRFEQMALLLPGVGRITAWVKSGMGRLIHRHPDGASLLFGVLNGLLPCGLVYAALAGAIASVGPMEGALFMIVFGLGTSPLMIATAYWGRQWGRTLKTRFRTIQPILLAVAGLLLLQRGLHLDLSLFESAVPPADLDCH